MFSSSKDSRSSATGEGGTHFEIVGGSMRFWLKSCAGWGVVKSWESWEELLLREDPCGFLGTRLENGQSRIQHVRSDNDNSSHENISSIVVMIRVNR